MNLNNFKLLITDLDGALVKFKCNWKLIKKLKLEGNNEKAKQLEIQGAIDSEPMDEIINILVQFQGPKALFSMNTREAVDQALNKFHIADEFNIIIAREDVKNPKPNPEGLQLIHNKFPYSKQEIIYVGDRAIDLIAGKQFGITTTTPTTLIMSGDI